MIKAVIFDMDGTVLNTLEDIMIAANHALRLKGLPEKSRDDIRKAVGNGARKLIERIVPESYTTEKKFFLEFIKIIMIPIVTFIPIHMMVF